MNFDRPDEVVDHGNKTYHGTTKIKPANFLSGTYINCGFEHNDQDFTFNVGDHVRILNYKNIFAKSYNPNWSEEVFEIKKVKNTIP